VNDELVGDAATELLDMRARRRVVPDLPIALRPTLTIVQFKEWVRRWRGRRGAGPTITLPNGDVVVMSASWESLSVEHLSTLGIVPEMGDLNSQIEETGESGGGTFP
jgi:hypothetical protein